MKLFPVLHHSIDYYFLLLKRVRGDSRFFIATDTVLRHDILELIQESNKVSGAIDSIVHMLSDSVRIPLVSSLFESNFLVELVHES